MNLRWLSVAIPAVALVSYCALLWILYVSRKNRIVRAYTGFIIVMLVWSFTSLLMRISGPARVLFWNRAMVTAIIFGPVFLYNFSLIFTKSRNRMLFILTTTVGAGLTALNLLGHMVHKIDFDPAGNLQYEIGFGVYIMSVFGIVLTILSALNILHKVRQGAISFKSVQWIIGGIFILLIGSLSNILPTVGTYRVDILANVVNAGMIGYSIFNYRFLNIKFIIRKGMAYTLFTLAMTAVFVSLVYGVESILRNRLGYTRIVLGFSIALIITVFLQPIWRLFQSFSERVYLREEFEQRKILKSFTKNLVSILDLKELSESLLDTMTRGLNCTNAAMLLGERDGVFRVYNSTDKAENGKVVFHANHPLTNWFGKDEPYLFIDDLDTIPLFKSLWKNERAVLDTLGVELILPIRLRNSLIGLLLLSAKKSGKNYYSEELELLSSLASSAAAMIENATLYERAKLESITDDLTKLFNHRHFNQVLASFIADPAVGTFSLLLADMDYFKLYNDIYGHHEGDVALEQTARIFKQHVGARGTVFRYGGEEFAALMPGMDGPAALEIADSIRGSVKTWFDENSHNIHKFLTISIGIASWPQNARSTDEILKCADIALDVAKRTSRNRCILYGSVQGGGIEFGKSDEPDKNHQGALDMYSALISSLVATIDAKDHYTSYHSNHVARYGAGLGRAIGLDDNHVEIIFQAGLLHDIGKIGIPESILLKEGPLDAVEYGIIKKHVDYSIEIIKHSPSLNKMIPAVLYHHERWDGTGYPSGISGTKIPVEARCLSIADSFDSIVTDRCYRKARSMEMALAEIKACAGTRYDPELVDVFLKLFEDGTLDIIRPT